MITAVNNVACFRQPGGCQEFLHRKVRELYNWGAPDIDNGKQTGCRRQNRINRISQAPTLMEFRNWSSLEIECEQLGEFLDAKRAGRYRNELKQSMGEFPVRLIDLSQGSLICLVQRLWQLG